MHIFICILPISHWIVKHCKIYIFTYIDKEISKILYNNDYIGIGIIDSCKGNLYMRAAHFEGMEVEEQKSYVYDDIVKQMRFTLERRCSYEKEL